MNQLITSLEHNGAPRHILAALELLQFQSPSTHRLASLTDAERHRFLQWSDDRQLTLMLLQVCGSSLPDWCTPQILQRTSRYEQRYERLKRELFEIAAAFDAAGLEFVMLKGLSHAPAFTPDARLRGQGDIDLWLIGSSVYKGQAILKSLNYEPALNSKSRHLPPMARPSDWQWRGDLFDAEMPISIELHYELWSERAEGITAPRLHQFWDRKQARDFDGHHINVLCEADLLGFAALHLLLHLLHGDLPLQRAWEIARFLDTHASDDVFWRSWRDMHPKALRQLETSVFHLVTTWFGCRATQELGLDVENLPVMIKSWLKDFSLAPLTREWAPNKSELWLHLGLIQKRREKARILCRRLLPTSLRYFACPAASQASVATKLLTRVRQLRFVARRFTRHAITFFPTLFEGLRWYWLRKS